MHEKTRKWIGAAIGIAAIAVAALVGTGVISSDASAGDRRGPGGFPGGGQFAPPGGGQFTPPQGGPQFGPGQGFPGQRQAPTTTSIPKATTT